jgi:hypothetical protein
MSWLDKLLGREPKPSAGESSMGSESAPHEHEGMAPTPTESTEPATQDEGPAPTSPGEHTETP